MKFDRYEYLIINNKSNRKTISKECVCSMYIPYDEDKKVDYNIRFRNCTDILHYVLARVDDRGYITEEAELEMLMDNTDKRFRKPQEYLYSILNNKVLLEWKCTEFSFSYDMESIKAIYKLDMSYELKEKYKGLYAITISDKKIDMSKKDINMWKKRSYKTYNKFNYK